ncbi:MAG: hemerythrin domain-containing protein [Bacteroidales bacterium]|nr:hemerythrin domain-containing protein [Bacteroidales bacterium]
MYRSEGTYIKAEMKIAPIIFENPSLLLLMERFGIEDAVQDKTVATICSEESIECALFLSIINLYNGFIPEQSEKLNKGCIETIIRFLKNSHNYYLEEKIPDIQNLIRSLFVANDIIEIRLIEKFFTEYSNEVKDHLSYEDNIAFPYFYSLLGIPGQRPSELNGFSAQEYKDHHTDIESKLTELKTLLIKYIPLKNSPAIKRKLLTSLFELEYDLTIHSRIEELVLIPLIKKLENIIE